MAFTDSKSRQGPFYPLGLVTVASAGTPVALTVNVDSAGTNAPGSPADRFHSTASEYTLRCQQIIFQGVKAGTSHGVQNNSGTVYILLKGYADRDDYGGVVLAIAAGATVVLTAAALNRNAFSPYNLAVDADTNGDAVLATMVIA